MLLKTKGISFNVHSPIVGIVCTSTLNCTEDSILVTNTHEHLIGFSKYKAVITTCDLAHEFIPTIFKVSDINHLTDGDIVVVNTDGIVNTLYRTQSNHNSLLVTERCNSNCLMCSQPPKDRDDIHYLFQIHEQLIPLIPKDCIEIGITGGEPTLTGDYFFKLLELLKFHLPDTEIHCLTNGRTFAWKNIANRLADLQCNRLMLGIPLYSDSYELHDYIVQAPNAFNQTINGLYNLATVDQRIELRVVLHALTIPRLLQLSKFIYKNLPFVEHVAFMGLEYIGYTPHNIQKLWIDPYDYQQELAEAVHYLSDFGMNVSIYNSQLCVTPESLWKFSRKSISDWKNDYLPVCESCKELENCGGLFTWNLKKHSNLIRPFLA